MFNLKAFIGVFSRGYITFWQRIYNILAISGRGYVTFQQRICNISAEDI